MKVVTAVVMRNSVFGFKCTVNEIKKNHFAVISTHVTKLNTNSDPSLRLISEYGGYINGERRPILYDAGEITDAA